MARIACATIQEPHQTSDNKRAVIENTEQTIKALLLDFLIEKKTDENQVLFSELPFFDGHRRADIVRLDSLGLAAFEIKSSSDNLEKLPAQLIDYNSSFEYTYLVLATKHLKPAIKIAKKNIGIFIVENGELTKVRHARGRKRLKKNQLLGFMTKQMILDAIKHQSTIVSLNKKNSKYELIHQLSKRLTLNEIKEISRVFLRQKYQPRFDLFIKERGSGTSVDDLVNLSREVYASLFQ